MKYKVCDTLFSWIEKIKNINKSQDNDVPVFVPFATF